MISGLPMNRKIAKELTNVNKKLETEKSDYSIAYDYVRGAYDLRSQVDETTNRTMIIGSIFDDCLNTDYGLWIDPDKMIIIANFINFLKVNNND